MENYFPEGVQNGPFSFCSRGERPIMIWGITGQDGSYLAELLLKNGETVVGMARRLSVDNTERIADVINDSGFELVEADITDYSSVFNHINKMRPKHIYNLAAQSNVGTSFNHPFNSIDITERGQLNILEAVRSIEGYNPRIYFAASSEMFGKSYDVIKAHELDKVFFNVDDDRYQGENTKMVPQSPYAIAKLAGFNYSRLYRDSYGMDVRCGILFNHESERRGLKFVTRKITDWIGRYKYWHSLVQGAGYWCRKNTDTHFVATRCDGRMIMENVAVAILHESHEKFPKLSLGNINSYRDWGHAKDYVRAMHLIMEADEARDWVVSTGETHTVAEFLRDALDEAGLTEPIEHYVLIDEGLMRPSEVPFLRGDSSQIRKELGWEPTITYKELVSRMVKHDIARYNNVR